MTIIDKVDDIILKKHLEGFNLDFVKVFRVYKSKKIFFILYCETHLICEYDDQYSHHITRFQLTPKMRRQFERFKKDFPII